MLKHVKIRGLDDFFAELNNRPEKGVYFYRITGYNEQVGDFLVRYYEAARADGVIIEGRIPNPDENNLSYYEEIMGLDFQMSLGFFDSSLKKWLPRMNPGQRSNMAAAVYDTLDSLRRSGKNENMLKNAYIKFMCWLYYKFERIVNRLGDNKVPKILYEGDVSFYELLLLSVLCGVGCDIVLLQYGGDRNYLKIDAASERSEPLEMSGLSAFPPQFGLKRLREDIQKRLNRERMYGEKPELQNCTNAWISGKGFEDIKRDGASRGNDPALFYNCLIRINGVKDKLEYVNELYQFQSELKHSGRRVVIEDLEIPPPALEEINAVPRKNYASPEQMLTDLAGCFQFAAPELRKLMRKAFLDIMLEIRDAGDVNLSRLTGKAVYLVCWAKRYGSRLFQGWKRPETGCFIHLGGCRNENEAMFLRFLARLPADVLVLKPDLSQSCCLQDPALYEINYPEALEVNAYPQESAEIRVGTAAYHAERELDSILYEDSGMYRNQQYGRAVTINLQTIYEEIALLWDQEVKYRPNFSVADGTVNIPAVFAKVSGVKDGLELKYWQAMRKLMTAETFVVKNPPLGRPEEPNPVKAHAAEFLRNGKLQKARIKAHPSYRYGFLREEMQEHMLDKIQLLIGQKTIKGTFENGAEYAVIAAALNLNKEFLRMIQKFDFTKKNPKLIYIHTGEEMIPQEDAVTAAFLNLVGFDVLFFVPTGYQSAEKYYSKRILEEHQIGEYMYDLRVPDFNSIPANPRPNWRDKIFKRGR